MSSVMKVSEVVYREDLYPRISTNPELIQKYAENLEVLPPIEINQHNILIDGFHRWTAYKKMEQKEIPFFVTETKSELELFGLAIEKNSKHGMQMNDKDKRKSAIRLYAEGTGKDKKEIARILSVSDRSVNNYLGDIDKKLREERKEKIFAMWMQCYTQEEIGEEVKLEKMQVSRIIEDCIILENLPKSYKLNASYQDSDFEIPLFNIWSFAKKTNNVSHFGNTEQRIVDNLLYLYTQPFDIVFDPFAGGGSTIDVCKKRYRRYFVSDRKPIIEREKEIRLLDICQEMPDLGNRWKDVSLTYLDPPYWKQAEGKYSNDKEDLANMPLEEFTNNIVNIVKNISKKQSKGVIALIIQPTQWKSENKKFNDHITDIISGVGNKRLELENRVSCPYSTEQYNAQQVEWAKQNKKLLVISRELIIWKLVNNNV
jgi:DNA-binding CsgD family transcriptional regulator